MAVKDNMGLLNLNGVTNLRTNKRGQWQYSTDYGKNYHNYKTFGEWTNIFTAPMGDLDGDGQEDDVLTRLKNIEESIDDLEVDIKPIPEVDIYNIVFADL